MKLRTLWNTWWKKLFWLGGVPVLLVVALLFWVWLRYAVLLSVLNPWLPPQLQFAHPVFRDVVGDLGGVPVTIPRHYISLVEYEGDPGWGKREGPVPERNHHSKLTSFSIDFRWPDMVAASTQELKAERRNASINETMWMFFGVGAGHSYHQDGLFLERLASSVGRYAPFKYEKLPKAQHGLTVYTPVGVDPGTRVPFKSDSRDKDIFVHHNADGEVDAYIECSNVGIASAPCGHTFSLAPHIKAEIRVHYRRGLLPEWQSIQTQIVRLIESWEIDPAQAQSPAQR